MWVYATYGHCKPSLRHITCYLGLHCSRLDLYPWSRKINSGVELGFHGDPGCIASSSTDQIRSPSRLKLWSCIGRLTIVSRNRYFAAGFATADR